MNCRAKPRREEGAGRDHHHHHPQGARGKKIRAGHPPPQTQTVRCASIYLKD